MELAGAVGWMPAWEANLSPDLKGKRIGIPKEYRIDGVPAEIDACWERGIEWLKDAGAEIVPVSALKGDAVENLLAQRYLLRPPSALVWELAATTILHALSSQSVDILLAFCLMVGGTVGAQFGASAGKYLRGEQLRAADSADH